MKSMLISGTDSIVGNSIRLFLEERSTELKAVHWRLLLSQMEYRNYHTILLNILSQQQSHAEFVSYLNNNREKLHNTTVVVIAESSLARICVELLYVDKVIVLTDKSPLCDFYQSTLPISECLRTKYLLAKKRLSRREQQILRLLVGGYSPKEISELVHLNYKTIQSHKMRIISKMALKNSVNLNKLIVMFNSYQ